MEFGGIYPLVWACAFVKRAATSFAPAVEDVGRDQAARSSMCVLLWEPNTAFPQSSLHSLSVGLV